MPGLAVLINKAIPEAKSLHLFYNTQELNLGIALKDGSASPSDPSIKLVSAANNNQGLIVNGTSLGCAEYQGMNIVAALTQGVKPAGVTEFTKYDVSIVSPVYMPLSNTEKDNLAMAMASSGPKAWIYYLSGTDANSIRLNELSVDTKAVTTMANTTQIVAGSELAAYYDVSQSKRYVLYQEADDQGRIFEFCVDTKTPLPINNSNNTKEKTCFSITLAGANVYLYYLGKGNVIYRVVKDVTKGSWGPSLPVDGAQKCETASDLTVVTANNVNHLFYQPKDAGKFEFAHFADTLTAVS